MGGVREGHFHINLCGMCRFSGYHFSAQNPEPGAEIDQKFLNRLWLFVQEKYAIVPPMFSGNFCNLIISKKGIETEIFSQTGYGDF